MLQCSTTSADAMRKRSVVNALHMLVVFFVPILAGLAFFYAREIHPFGDNSLLSIDLWGQYFPMFRQYAGTSSLAEAMYSWNGALGFNNFVQSAFYCHSPFLWVMKLLPVDQYIIYIDAICLLRLGLAALMCQLFLEFKYKSRSPILMGLSISYGLCAYAVAYIMQFMWTDLIVIAPLVLLGLEYLFDGRTPLLYIGALGFAIYANFYVAFGVCIFTAVYFAAELIKRLEFDMRANRLRKLANRRELGKMCGRFALYSALAGALNAVTIIPTLKGLSLSASASTTAVEFDKWYHTFAENLSAMLPQTEVSHEFGVANIATGLFVFVLLPLYFFNVSIRYREKLATGLLLAFLYCGLNYNPLDYVFNGGHFPNQLPGRWSFMFSLAIVLTAANGVAKIDGIKLKTVISSCVAGVAFLLFTKYGNLSSLKEEYLLTWVLWLVLFCALFACYIVFRTYYRRLRQDEQASPRKTQIWRITYKLCCVALAVVMSVEVCSNAVSVASVVDGGVGTSNYVIYNDAMDIFTTYGEQYDSGEDTFYRTETNEGWTFDDGQLGGFKSVGYYGSTMNGRMFRLLRYMGNRVYTQNISSLYNNTSPVQNSLFGIRYFIDRGKNLGDRLWGVEKVAEYEDAIIWENPLALPLAFAAADSVKDIVVEDSPHMKDDIRAIYDQNEFINQLYGNTVNVFEPAQATMDYTDCVLVPSANWFENAYHSATSETVFTYTYVCDDERPVYFEQNFKSGKMIVEVNGNQSEVNTLTEPFKYVGTYPAGTVITVTVSDVYHDGLYALNFYTLNPLKWQMVYHAFSDNGLEVQQFKSTRVTGVMTADTDTAVFTSIPQDEGWSVYVDGKQVKTYLVAGALVGFDLTSGTHEITLRYRVPGFTLGLIITIVALLVAAFCVWRHRRRGSGVVPAQQEVTAAASELQCEPLTVKAETNVTQAETTKTDTVTPVRRIYDIPDDLE